MEEALLQRFRKELLDRREKLLLRIHDFDDAGLGIPLQDSIVELSVYDNHPADIGSEVFERSKDSALRENAALELIAVEDALARIDKGTYGICTACGRPIDLERLEACPSTTMCKECKKAEEDMPLRNTRPVEEDVLVTPFERTFNDAKDQVEFDGEDSWQAVGSYNERPDVYYQDVDLQEHHGYVEDVENIPYYRGEDGVIYENKRFNKR